MIHIAQHIPSGERFILEDDGGGEITAIAGPYQHSDPAVCCLPDARIALRQDGDGDDINWANDQDWHVLTGEV